MQWAAVMMVFSLKTEPPQKWYHRPRCSCCSDTWNGTLLAGASSPPTMATDGSSKVGPPSPKPPGPCLGRFLLSLPRFCFVDHRFFFRRLTVDGRKGRSVFGGNVSRRGEQQHGGRRQPLRHLAQNE